MGDSHGVRRIDALFARYGESHRHPTNKAIHWICVPLITWSLLAALWAWTPMAAYALVALAMVFYVTLSWPIAIGMLAVSALMLFPLTQIAPQQVLIAAAVVFVLAWIGQFIGHRIERRKPSFFEDIKFLLVGPAWLLAFVYRRLGIAY
jgi:uncharacterized membrane protein YGL010W